jgi:MFS family permease
VTSAASARAVRAALLAVAAYRGLVEAIPGTSATFVRDDFGLDEPALARLLAWIALASAGALWLGRLFDLRGRRPVLLACLAAVPGLSLLTAIAPGTASYAAAQIALFALVTAILAGATVVMAETMPDASRAAALGQVGIADAVGGGITILLMPLAADLPGSWRWLWAVAVLPVIGLGAVRRAIPETPHWERRDAAQGLGIVFAAHRARALHLTGSLLLVHVAFGGLLFWPYYHLVERAGLSLAAASGLVLGAGAVSLLGFVAGGWLADRAGRRLTAVAGTFVAAAGGAAFYTSGASAPIALLAVSYALFLGAISAALLATQAAALELFPTPVRATLATWYAALAASGVVIAQVVVAALADDAGSLSRAVAAIGLLGIPGIVWFGAALPETRHATLDSPV